MSALDFDGVAEPPAVSTGTPPTGPTMAGAFTFGSLFSGIGGLDLGLERVGMTCKWQVEIDDYATRVLERHWPTVPRFRDVRDFPSHSQCTGLAEREDEEVALEPAERSRLEVDLIAAGFPCQDISYAGKGAGLDGKRSGLFWEAMRVVRVLEPRWVLLENVAALLTRGLPEVLGTLASLGYDAEWHCVPAASVGAPHIRDRIFIVAHTNGHERHETIGSQAAKTGGRRDDQEHSVGRPSPQSSRRDPFAGAGLGAWFSQRPSERTDWLSESGLRGIPNGLSGGLDRDRKHRIRCLGNAVVPQVAEYLGNQIVEAERWGLGKTT